MQAPPVLDQPARKMAPAPSPEAEKAARLGPWFHNLHLPDGTQTCPEHWLGDFPAFKWRQVECSIPSDLTGWSCLDIGCNAGFYSFELARRGGQVLGIDPDERYLRQARWAAGRYRLGDKVRFRQMSIYDLSRYGEDFDLVLFLGVFYHLRYPMLGLDLACLKTRRLMLFQTFTMPGAGRGPETPALAYTERERLTEEGWPKMAFMEHGFAGDPANWWVPNHAACLAMLRSAGMSVTDCPAHEFYLCHPDPARPSCVETWNAPELMAATGRSTPLTRSLHA